MEFRRLTGTLYVISAPSGTGKTTLCRYLLDNVPDIRVSVSFTTRPMRQGEVEGVSYSFIDVGTFKLLIEGGEFLEWAEVHGNFYGTSQKRIDDILSGGCDVILDIDTQGALQLKEKGVDAVYVFILPPSMEILERRLRGRNTDSEEAIKRRLDVAREEIANFGHYDYIVINDKLKNACSELESIIHANRLKTEKMDKKVVVSRFELG